MDSSMSGFPVLHNLLEFVQTHGHWVKDAIQLSHLLSPPSPPALNLSQQQSLFQWIGSLHQVVKDGDSASASVLPVNIQGWFPSVFTDLISLQSKGLSKGSSKALILQHSAFFIVQLSHPYMTTGKTRVLTRWAFVGKVMSLLFNMLSRFVIVFLPKSKHLLISSLQSPSKVILEPKKIKSDTVSIFSPHPFAKKWWDQMPWSSFFKWWALNQLFHSPLSLSSRGSLVLHFLP